MGPFAGDTINHKENRMKSDQKVFSSVKGCRPSSCCNIRDSYVFAVATVIELFDIVVKSYQKLEIGSIYCVSNGAGF